MISTVLLVEDNPGDARLLREMFSEAGSFRTEVRWVTGLSDAEAYLRHHDVDVILLDLGLTDAQGLAAVRRTHAAAPRTPIVVLTGLDDEAMAAQALHEGAEDYLVKGQNEARGLIRSIRYAIERKALEEALVGEKERAQLTLNCIGDAVACTNTLGKITFLNLAAEAMTGWSSAAATGRALPDIFRIVDADGRRPTPTMTGLDEAATQTVYLPQTCVLVRRDGSEIPIDGTIAPIHDSDGRNTGAVAVLRDATAARAMTRQIIHSAQHDYLTGLPNRLLLNDRIGQAIAMAARHESQLGIVFLDVDGFKHINDSLGHQVGDRLLQSIASRLVGGVRASDTVSRQGGDEFVILLSQLRHPQDSVLTAKRLLAAVAEPHIIDQHDLQVTASIGVSVYPDDALDAETLIKNADIAMYSAKENGRQGYQFFTAAMNARAVERQSIEEGLRRAVERREFVLHYQPKIDLRTGAITGSEALIRWMHPVRGLLMPGAFIHVAEDCGLIRSIGAWVLREACTQARAWADAGLPYANMAVNVSSIEFHNENYLESVLAVLNETGLEPRSLELELTESVLMKHVESAAPMLQTLRQSGVRLTIDDFGTGYSSLSYLHKFRVHSLKIDQSFVRQITVGGEEMHIVSAVIDMARNLNLRVVAEGVEHAEELAFLSALRCDEAQGYYFSRPVPPAAFAALLRNGIAHAAPERDADLIERVPEVTRPDGGAHGAARLQ